MTQVVQVAHSFSTKAVELVINSVVDYAKAFHKSLLEYRQREANAKIVPLIRHEYPKLTDYEILQLLDQRTLND
jgi:hypothetical protein